ncbi:MAG TPA: MFS transporter [Ktedonobacterales bacterium]|nr:MFS transporter [Ktedonobacterales bacterium]
MRPRYWHIVLAVFFLGWVFMYADRTVLSPVLATIGSEWRLSTSQLGLISSLFFLAYAALQLPTGWLADRFGRKLLLVPGYLLFGITTLLSAFAPSYGIFLLLATLTGLGEGTYYPTQFSLSSEVIPRRFRSFGSAIINSGQAVGISLGFIASGFVAFTLNAGWRTSFAVLGVATVLAGLVIALLIRERPAASDAPAEVAAPNTSTEEAATRLLSRDLVLAYIAGFCSLYGFFVIITWLPYYLQTARHEPSSLTGVISSLVPWASVPGALLISYLSDRVHARRAFALLMMPVAALALLFIPLSQSSAALFGALVLYGLVGKLALDPILVAYVADRVPRTAYSRAYAILNFSGMLSSILAPYLTGYLANRFGSLDTGFYLATALLLVGALCMAFTRREKILAAGAS